MVIKRRTVVGRSAGGGFSKPLPYERRRKPKVPMALPIERVARFVGDAKEKLLEVPWS